MDDTTPENLNPEELLSAYLDGEVTAAQRAQVEQMLASDPEARAALDELRALSIALQSLPKLSVGEDLSERVLRRAERAMLERHTTDPAVSPAAIQQAPPGPSSSSSQNSLADKNPAALKSETHDAGWVRRLAWPMAAIAATVLVMLVSQKQKPELALAPANSAKQAPDASTASDAMVHSAPESEALEAAPDEEGDFVAGKGFKSDAGWANKKAGREFDSYEQNLEVEPQQEFLSDQTAGKSQVTSTENQAKMQSARASAKHAGAGNGRLANSAERQLQAAAVPGAALSNASAADAKQARAQTVLMQAPVELVVEVVASDEATEVDAFDDLLAMQNIRVDDFDANHRRKQLAQDENSFRDEQNKDREAAAFSGSAPQANDQEDKQSLGLGKPGAQSSVGSQQPKLAETKEQEKKSEFAGQIAKSPNAAQPSSPPAIRGNNGLPEPGKPAPAPPAEALADNASDQPAKKFGNEEGDKSGQGGEELELTRQVATESTNVEVVLVTASPAQVRELLKVIESRSDQYRALPLDLSVNPQNAEDRPTSDGEKKDSQVDSLAANRANLDPAKNAPPAPAEAAKSPAPEVSDRGHAVRWRVSEDQLASLLLPESLHQLSVGDRSYWFDMKAAEQPVDGIHQTEKRKETLDQKRSREGLSGDADSATLRSEVSEGAAKASAAEKNRPGVKAEAKQSATSAPADQRGDTKKLKAPAGSEPLAEKSEYRPTEKESGEVETPGTRLPIAKGNDALFGAEPGRDQGRRSRLDEQLQDGAANEQIRVLFVLRGRNAENRRGQSGVAGQSSTGVVQPNAAEPIPAAESTPAEATPAKE